MKNLSRHFGLGKLLLAVTLGFGAVAGIPPAHAQTCSPNAAGATCDGSGPASQGSTSGVDSGAGNPINVLNGNKYQREVDLSALPGELGLELVRHYNSAHAYVPGALGAGWRLSYETDLHLVGQTVQIIQADGSRLIFNKDSTNPSQCSGADPRNGRIHIRTTSRGPAYTWHWTHGPHAGRRLHFNSGGKLEEIQAPSGARVLLTRGPSGELLQVTDPQGRSLRLGYTPKADIAAAQAQAREQLSRNAIWAGVTTIDTPLGRYSYQHGTTPESAANLTGVDLPTHHDASQRAHPGANRGMSQSAIRKTYQYEDPRHPHHLSGISISGTGSDGQFTSQRISTWRFDERGRGIHSEAAGETLTLSYPASAGPGREGRTVLTDAQGRQTTYRHAVIAGEHRLLSSEGAGCASCGPANARYRYDALGRLTEMQAQAQGPTQTQGPTHTQRWHHDTQGRLIRREDGQGSWERYAYAADGDQPTLIARPSVVPGREHQIHIRYNERGQPLQVTESGFEPVKGQAISRSTTYTYAQIERSGRSVLTQIDGPLPNGPGNTPQDSDITRFEWDERGSFVTALIQPGGRTSRMTYTEQGWVQRVTNAEGAYTRFTYDHAGRIVRTEAGGDGWESPRLQEHRYNALGQPTESLNPGRPWANWYAQWDGQGRLQTLVSALGHWQRWHHGDQAQSEPASATGSLPATAVPRPGASLRWMDDWGRTVRVQSPEHGQHELQHDEADRLVGMRDAMGHSARYHYDLQGRIQRQDITDARTPDTPMTTTWEYQGQRLIRLQHPSQAERYEYDSRGLRSARIVTLRTQKGEHTAVTRYLHDEQGTLVATVLPDGSRLHHRRDGLGRATALVRQRLQTRWLAALAPEQTLATDIAHDMRGLAAYTAGNGIHSHWQRSHHANAWGALARLVHRHPNRKPAMAAPLARNTQELIERLLGTTSAHAQTAQPAPPAPPAQNPQPAQPGLLDQAADPNALIDTRYLWSSAGPLLLTQGTRLGQREQDAHAYDPSGQLIASVRSQAAESSAAWQEQAVWRYAHDASQRRLLAQQGVADQGEQSETQTLRYRPASHQRLSAGAGYNANGQPTQWPSAAATAAANDAPPALHWDALGRLTQVGANNEPLARYTYDHRGLRISQQAGDQTTHTLYDDNRQPLAELGEDGHIRRLYIWLGHGPAALPLAVIDAEAGTALAPADPDAWHPIAQAGKDAVLLVRLWLAELSGSEVNERTAWLHVNHLGAPELATDRQAQVIWQARYAPFGQADVKARAGFTLSLRLPGQVYDPETGWHYNRQRYYDPEAGQYLTPDPLGHPDGPNPYAYAANDPLRFIDPDGLILFAFDGTGNSDEAGDPAMSGNGMTNVVLFRDLYADGEVNYITGVGTVHKDQEYGDIVPDDYAKGKLIDWLTPNTPLFYNDMGGNYSGPARIDRMVLYLRDEVEYDQRFLPASVCPDVVRDCRCVLGSGSCLACGQRVLILATQTMHLA